MTFNEELTLVRDTRATMIPSGDEHVLKAGSRAVISQALGGTVTIRTDRGLFRVAGKDVDALGETALRQLEAAGGETADAGGDEPFSEKQVWDAMKQCYDPEIPVNIVDLGLVYDLGIEDSADPGRHEVNVKMTLTAQGCGMGPVIADDARQRIEALPAVSKARVEIVWDPPWSPHMISEAGRQKLGLD